MPCIQAVGVRAPDDPRPGEDSAHGASVVGQASIGGWAGEHRGGDDHARGAGLCADHQRVVDLVGEVCGEACPQCRSVKPCPLDSIEAAHRRHRYLGEDEVLLVYRVEDGV